MQFIHHTVPARYKKSLQHLLAVVFFFVITLLLFHPGVLDGKVLNQHDILQWKGGAQETLDYREKTGEEAHWTNSMFSGMPTTLVSTHYSGDVILYVQQIISLGIPRPFSLIFLAFICFFILMLSFGVRVEIAVFSALCFGASSFLIIGVMAGHNSRIAAIAFLPLVVAGVKFIFERKYAWGFFFTAMGLALEIRVNHLQITYYLALILVIFGISHLIISIRNGTLAQLKFQLPTLLLAVLLALGANYGKLSNILAYSKESTRGKSELKIGESGSGLDKNYVFEFSNGIAEPLVLFIPNFFGGSSYESLGEKSHVAKALSAKGLSRLQMNQYLQSVPTYWGDQRLTAPYYAGAIVVFLFVLGLLILDLKTKGWLLAVTILGIILSWGDNFQLLNYFLFDYLPEYNKFRSVTFTLILAIFGITTLAALALQKLLTIEPKKAGKKILQTALIVGGFALLAAVLAGFGSYRAPIDEQMRVLERPEWFIDAIRADRARMLRLDSLRSAFFVFTTAAIIWLMVKNRLRKELGLILIILLGVADVVMIDKRYLDKDKFQYDVEENYFKPTAADNFIHESNSNGGRVLNLQNPFNEALTSYHHSSIGGYHGAKLRRYQELIKNHISPEMDILVRGLQSGDLSAFESAGVINMLNTRFLKYGSAKENVIVNDRANGPAWFVDAIFRVNSADEELQTLGKINTKTHAVIDVSKFQIITIEPDSLSTVSVETKEVNKLKYLTSSNSNGFVVFSEIYYPEGWVATINGEPTDIIRANYVLRGVQVPVGDHEIEFRFEAINFQAINNITLASGIAIFVLSFGLFFVSFKKQ